jgi:hypothetical protein
MPLLTHQPKLVFALAASMLLPGCANLPLPAQLAASSAARAAPSAASPSQKQPDGTDEHGPGPSTQQQYRTVVLAENFPMPLRAGWPQPLPTKPGCGRHRWIIWEDALGGGEFSDPYYTDRVTYPNGQRVTADSHWTPIVDCTRAKAPHDNFRKEIEQAKRTLGLPWQPGDHAWAEDADTWVIVRNEIGPIGRYFNVSVVMHQAPLPLICNTDDPFDVCAATPIAFVQNLDDANKLVAMARTFEQHGEKNHCRVRLWQAFARSAMARKSFDDAIANGTAFDHGHAVLSTGEALTQSQLSDAIVKAQGEVRELFHRCGGAGDPPAE